MAGNDPTAGGDTVQETFTAFFEGWQVRQQSFLEQLKVLSVAAASSDGAEKEEECRNLVEQVLAHYQEYYEEKTKAANDDVFLLFSPPWFSSFERTLFWVSGFKPTLIFQLINRSVEDLSAEQVEKIEMVRVETRRKEREIGEAMARVQESVAEQPLFGLVRREERLVDGEVSYLDEAMEELKAAMLVVMGNADALRGMAAKEVLEILTPVQTMKLLAGKAQFWLQARRLGLERDSQRETTSAATFSLN